MPSIDDVYHQLEDINSNLEVLHGDDGLIKTSVDNVKSAVDEAVAQLKLLATDLVHLSHQTDTMICALENISRNTCMLLNEAHLQTELQKAIESHTSDAVELQKSAQPDAFLELTRLQALRTQIEECCPPPSAPPICEYRPCEKPPKLQHPKEPAPPR